MSETQQKPRKKTIHPKIRKDVYLIIASRIEEDVKRDQRQFEMNKLAIRKLASQQHELKAKIAGQQQMIWEMRR